MSFGRAIAQTVEGIPGVITPDQMTEAELQTLADTLRATTRAVDDELLERIAARCGRLPVSHLWPDEPDPMSHPLVRQVLARFPKGPAHDF